MKVKNTYLVNYPARGASNTFLEATTLYELEDKRWVIYQIQVNSTHSMKLKEITKEEALKLIADKDEALIFPAD